MFAKFEYIIGRLNRGNVRKGKKSKKVIQANAQTIGQKKVT